MYYILIDKETPLCDIAEMPSVLMSLMVTGVLPRVLLRYKDIPFTTNIPVLDNVALSGISGMINGDFKGIQLYVENDLYPVVDTLMNALLANGIMAMMMKI